MTKGDICVDNSRDTKESCASIVDDKNGSVMILNNHKADEELGGVSTYMRFNNKNFTVERDEKLWVQMILDSFKDMSTMAILGYTLTVVISLSVIVSVPFVTQTMGYNGSNLAATVSLLTYGLLRAMAPTKLWLCQNIVSEV